MWCSKGNRNFSEGSRKIKLCLLFSKESLKTAFSNLLLFPYNKQHTAINKVPHGISMIRRGEEIDWKCHWSYGILSAKWEHVRLPLRNEQLLRRNRQWFVLQFVRNRSIIGIGTSQSFYSCICWVRYNINLNSKDNIQIFNQKIFSMKPAHEICKIVIPGWACFIFLWF